MSTGILSLLVSIPLTLSLASSKDAGASESIYNVTTSVIDDAKESIFTMKLKCRPRTDDILTCNLSDPKYRSNYHATPCANSSLCNVEHIRPDNSYVGRFEIKHRNSCVERLTVSAHTTLKQVTFYRIMANHLFAGVDVTGKPEGTYSLIEQSVYGKCEALVKVVRTRIKDRRSEERLAKLVTIPATSNDTTTSSREMLSVKRTRNLETCSPLPGLLIFDSFFYHPMMTSVHFDIVSRTPLYFISFSSVIGHEIIENLERKIFTEIISQSQF